jgi:hypothetical protein
VMIDTETTGVVWQVPQREAFWIHPRGVLCYACAAGTASAAWAARAALIVSIFRP